MLSKCPNQYSEISGICHSVLVFDHYTTKKTEPWEGNWWKTVRKPLWSANSDLDFLWNLWFMFKPKCGLVQYRQIDLEFWDQIGAHSSLGPRLEVVGMSTCPIFVMKFFLSPSCLYSITTFLSSLYPFCPPLPSVSSSPCFPVGYVVIMFYIVLQPCMYMYLWNKVKI